MLTRKETRHRHVAGEATMTGKEHVIETVAVPQSTVSTGCSLQAEILRCLSPPGESW
jgi:hypothetical protein